MAKKVQKKVQKVIYQNCTSHPKYTETCVTPVIVPNEVEVYCLDWMKRTVLGVELDGHSLHLNIIDMNTYIDAFYAQEEKYIKANKTSGIITDCFGIRQEHTSAERAILKDKNIIKRLYENKNGGIRVDKLTIQRVITNVE